MLRLEYLSEAQWITETRKGFTHKPYFVEFKALDVALIYIKIRNSEGQPRQFRVVEPNPMSQLPVNKVVYYPTLDA